MDISTLRNEPTTQDGQGRSITAVSRQKSVYLRSPSSLQKLSMEKISRSREYYVNSFTEYSGFKMLTPPVLQMLIEFIMENTDRFLTPNFAKMLLNENSHFANIGCVDERFRQELYDYAVRNCCGWRLKIIRSLWVDGNLSISLHDLYKFKNLQSLEILQLECTDEVLQSVCLHFPNLRSLAVTFKDDNVSEDGIGCLENLEFLEQFLFKVYEEDASYYDFLIGELSYESNMSVEWKPFVVCGMKVKNTPPSKGISRKPVLGRLGSFLKKKFVRAFSREFSIDNSAISISPS